MDVSVVFLVAGYLLLGGSGWDLHIPYALFKGRKLFHEKESGFQN